MKKITAIILLATLASGRATAQDFHLSMYDAAPMFLNPAMTGLFNGQWRVHGQFRTQWKSVNYKPYTTALVSFDKPIGKWGVGVQISNSRAGAGNYNVLEGLLSLAYTVPLTKNRFHNLSFGIQGGAKQKSIEYQLLTFNNQYVTTNGGGFENSMSTNEDFGAQKRILPQVNVGALYYFSKVESRFNPFLGISAFNLLQPNESFFGQREVLPIRTYIHAGTRINLTESFYLIPKVLVMNQLKYFEQTYAIDAGYYMKGSGLTALGGVVFRSKDALVLSLGAKMDSFIAKVAYDINVSTLSLASTGRGGFEISFTYMKPNPPLAKNKICPRL